MQLTAHPQRVTPGQEEETIRIISKDIRYIHQNQIGLSKHDFSIEARRNFCTSLLEKEYRVYLEVIVVYRSDFQFIDGG